MKIESISFDGLSYTSKCCYSAILGLCAITSLVGNIISIVILRRPAMRSKSNRLLISLAVSDCLVGVHCISLTCYLPVDQLFLNYDILYLNFVLIAFLTVSSIISLAFISYDRFCKLDPQTYETKISDMKSKVMVAIAWIWPTVIQATLMLDFFYVTAALGMLTGITAAVVIGVSYGRIRQTIKSNTKILNNSTQDEETKQLRLHKDKKLARRLYVLILAYFACFVPLLSRIIIDMISIDIFNLDAKEIALQHLRFISIFGIYMDSAFNPIIHLTTNIKMRKALKKMALFSILNRIGSST